MIKLHEMLNAILVRVIHVRVTIEVINTEARNDTTIDCLQSKDGIAARSVKTKYCSSTFLPN